MIRMINTNSWCSFEVYRQNKNRVALVNDFDVSNITKAIASQFKTTVPDLDFESGINPIFVLNSFQNRLEVVKDCAHASN